MAFILADKVCMRSDDVARSQLLSTILFVCGLNTLMQTAFGSRYFAYSISAHKHKGSFS